MTVVGLVTCSECGAQAHGTGLAGWATAVLTLSPLEPVAAGAPTAGASTVDLLCPTCAAQAQAMMDIAADGPPTAGAKG